MISHAGKINITRFNEIFEFALLHQIYTIFAVKLVTQSNRQFFRFESDSGDSSLFLIIVVVWKGIHSRSDSNRTGAEGLSFYYPRLLYCPDQMLAVMFLRQHRVLSSKTVRLHVPRGARCMGHAIRTWSTVCSGATHSQFGEGAKPRLCMDEWNCPTPVRRRSSLTQAVRVKLIPIDLALVLGIKVRSLEVFSQYSAFHLWFVHSEARKPSPARLCKRFCAIGTNGHLDLRLSWRASEDPLKRPYKI